MYIMHKKGSCGRHRQTLFSMRDAIIACKINLYQCNVFANICSIYLWSACKESRVKSVVVPGELFSLSSISIWSRRQVDMNNGEYIASFRTSEYTSPCRYLSISSECWVGILNFYINILMNTEYWKGAESKLLVISYFKDSWRIFLLKLSPCKLGQSFTNRQFV